MDNWIQYIPIIKNGIVTFGYKLILFIVIFYVGKILANIFAKLTYKGLRKKGDETVSLFVKNLVYYTILILAIVAALAKIGIQTSSFMAIIGAAGLAIGLALQGSLSNFAAGFLIIMFKPFRVGDVVEVAGKTGGVETIQIFTTTLKTPDNKTIIIPNSAITGGVIVNYSKKETRRVDLTIGVGYDDDIKLVQDTLKQIIANDNRILKDPEPFVRVAELADSSVNFAVRVWAKSADYWGVYFDLIEKIKLTFDSKNISFPYPQQDVHLYQENNSK